MNTKLDGIINAILDSYKALGGINHLEGPNLPSRQSIITIVDELESIIFPGYRDEANLETLNMKYILGEKISRIAINLSLEVEKSMRYYCKLINDENKTCVCREEAEQITGSLLAEIPEIRRRVQLDVEAAFRGDPAASSREEIILSYPGVEAIMIHRVAHELYKKKVPFIPRIMSEYMHSKTGVDIHPGAEIGDSFFIDHATGVVIGETAIIGNNVKIYQGVTLGALSVKKEYSSRKRHPTIEDDVTIYAGAKILGGETVIGRGSVIGGNVWLVSSVPPNSNIVYKPENYTLKPGTYKDMDFQI